MHWIEVQRIWDPGGRIEEEAQELLDAGSDLHEVFGRSDQRYPLLNIAESEQEFCVCVEVPGFRRDDLQVDMSEQTLLLQCRRPRPHADERFRRQERWFGEWQRQLTFPKRIDVDGVSADLQDGILAIHVPKAAESGSRRIHIQEGAASRYGFTSEAII